MIIRSESELLDEGIRAKVINDIDSDTESKTRKEEHRKRREVYNDRTREWALRLIEKEFSGNTALEMQHRTPNLSLTKKIVDKKARVYKDRPLRVAETKAKQKMLDRLATALCLDGFMKRVNRAVELHRNILVKVLPTRNTEQSTDSKPMYDLGLEIVRPDAYDIIPDPANPTKPLAVILSLYDDDGSFLQDYASGDTTPSPLAESYASKGKQRDKRVFIFWTRNYHFATDAKGKIVKSMQDDLTHPYGCLPFVPFAKEQAETYWTGGGEGLADNAILINVLIADMNFSAKYQSTGVGYIFGDNIPQTVDIGPNKFLRIAYKEGEPVPQIGFATPNPSLGENRQIIEQQLAFFLSSEGLEPGSISGSLGGQADATSGIQEMIRKSEPITSIEDEQQLYKDTEPEVLDVAAKILEYYASHKALSEEWAGLAELGEPVYTLSFDRPTPFLTDKEKLELVALKKASGFYTDTDLMRELFPDMGDKEIEEKKLELAADKAAKSELAPEAEPEEDDKEEDNQPEA